MWPEWNKVRVHTEKIPLRSPRLRWKDNIKLELK